MEEADSHVAPASWEAVWTPPWLGCVSSPSSSGSHPMEGTKTGDSFGKFLWAATLSDTVSLIKGSLSVCVTLLLVLMLAVPMRAYLSKSFYPDSCSSALTMCASAPGLGVEYNQPRAKFPISWITEERNLLACLSLCSPFPVAFLRQAHFQIKKSRECLGMVSGIQLARDFRGCVGPKKATLEHWGENDLKEKKSTQ